MTTEQQPTWNKFDHPRPYIGIIGFAYDNNGKFPILFRSNEVRSAKNAWSLVSGLHEVGKSLFQQFADECKEELNLTATGEGCKIGYYEAIIPEDGWHWLMVIVAMKVTGFHSLINKEPNKHSDVKIISIEDFYHDYIGQQWTPGTLRALLEYHKEIKKALVI